MRRARATHARSFFRVAGTLTSRCGACLRRSQARICAFCDASGGVFGGAKWGVCVGVRAGVSGVGGGWVAPLVWAAHRRVGRALRVQKECWRRSGRWRFAIRTVLTQCLDSAVGLGGSQTRWTRFLGAERMRASVRPLAIRDQDGAYAVLGWRCWSGRFTGALDALFGRRKDAGIGPTAGDSRSGRRCRSSARRRRAGHAGPTQERPGHE